jgi:hypothetical protein
MHPQRCHALASGTAVIAGFPLPAARRAAEAEDEHRKRRRIQRNMNIEKYREKNIQGATP